MNLLHQVTKLTDIASRGGKVPPMYLFLTFILPGFVFSFSKSGQLNYLPFILVSVAIMPLMAATNLFDDYFDYARGIDKPNSPNALYRKHPVFHYGVSTRYLLTWAILFSVVYLTSIFLISLKYGIVLNSFGVIGFLLGYFYTGPPIGYKYLGLGEVGVFFSSMAAGELIAIATLGHFYSQSVPFLIPFSLLNSLILFLGNYRDTEYDKDSGTRTMAVLLGERYSKWFPVSLFSVFYLSVVALYFLKIYNVLSLLDLLTSPFAYLMLARWPHVEKTSLEKFAGPYVFAVLFLLAILLSF